MKTSTCDSQRIQVEDGNPYLSRFNSDTWKSFVECRRPHQVVADLHKAMTGSPIWHCDVRSCRLHALTECNSHPIPVFSPIDEVGPTEGYHLCDYHWCEIPTSRLRSSLLTYAYDGARWYSKAEIQFMMEHGYCHWEDLKLSLQATAHMPAAQLATQLKFMREVWEQCGDTHAGETWAGDRRSRAKALLSKTAMLSLVGAWGRTENHRFTTVVSNHPDDCRFEGPIRTSLSPGSASFHDITYRQHVRSYGTYLPLSLVARSLERVNVARAILITLKHMRVERLLAIQVDCITFQPPKKVTRLVTEELEDMTYDQLHLASRRPLTKYAGPLQDPIRSKEKVYHLKKLDAPLVVGGALERNDTCQRPLIPTEEWIVRTEPTEGEDTFAESIIQHVLAGFSCMIHGAPGTGKSHLLAEIRDRLLEVGHTVETLAPTNAAARIIGGRTIHNFCARIGKSDRGFAGTLLIDEVSMVSLGLCAVLDISDRLDVGSSVSETGTSWSQWGILGEARRLPPRSCENLPY
jgi:hypothetical protein